MGTICNPNIYIGALRYVQSLIFCEIVCEFWEWYEYYPMHSTFNNINIFCLKINKLDWIEKWWIFLSTGIYNLSDNDLFG